MLSKARWYLRKAVFRTYRRLKHPRYLKGSRGLRWFARHFLDKDVWRPSQATFAGGTAVGVFVAAQLIPGQMPLAVLIAAFLRVNIPVAVVLCWLSNPVTFAPIGLFEKQVGDYLLDILGDPTYALLERIKNPDVAKGVRWAQSMYVGGIACGVVLAPIGYGLAWMSWTGVARLLRIPLVRLKQRRKSTPPKAKGEIPVEDVASND